MRAPALGLLMAFLCIGSFVPVSLGADAGAWDVLDAATKELRDREGELRVYGAAMDAAREAAALAHPADLAAARGAVEAAEKAVAAAHDGDLGAARERMQKAQAARDEKVEALLADAPTFRAALARRVDAHARITRLESRLAALTEAELLDLARLRLDEAGPDHQIAGARRAWWRRGEVEPEYKAADEAYKAYTALAGKSAALQEANEKLKSARKALADATGALPLDAPAAKALLARRAGLEAKIAEATAKAAALEKDLIGGATTATVTVTGVDRRSRQEVEKKITLWIPPHQEYIRGVVVAHPMIASLATGRLTRLAAAREGLATVVTDEFPGDGKQSLARLDGIFEKFAKESKHPELRGAPVLLGGLSASVLATRNIACAVPERVFGVVHAAGGNMQEMPDDGRGMVQVPFIAFNGEFEWASPIGGIRPEYGNQTQWVMIREQMLRLWRNTYAHRMTLVVVPGGDHGAWDQPLAALFIRKAAQYRLPKEKRDGGTPAVCAPLPVEKGWLTDADLDHPTFEPAPYDAYKGDKNNAFWHVDEEMARAVYAYHKDQFILPDPTKAHPVPADWPRGRK